MPDYIVIGGGSAGCTIAARLSEDPDVTVALLEAGPRDKSPYIHLPAGFYKLTGSSFTWGYETEPMSNANQRVMIYPQGKVLGGGSSINAQVFTRGCPGDYDKWAAEGCSGWSFDEVLPYFRRSEDNDIFADPYHGNNGPLGVSSTQPHFLSRKFVQAGQQFGMPYNADFNGAMQTGVGIYQTTTRNGRRCSAAVGYLRPASHRRNLTVQTGVLVKRIIFEKQKAVGVEVALGSKVKMLHADREVIVAAGAIGSPKVLLLSGIGPAEALRQLNISVVQNVPGVGENLQDHMDVDVIYELKGQFSYDKYKKSHWKLSALAEWLAFRKGPVTSNIVEAGAFWWSDRNEKTADIQLHFLPGAGIEAGIGDVPSGNGATLNSYHLRPRSRGTVRLRSADPLDRPKIDPNSFSDPYDLQRSIDGVKISREIMSQPAFEKYVKCEHFPGNGMSTQADYEAFVRKNARSAYHPVGTCKMGLDDMAVVDPKSLRVVGVDCLRVCDASIMPYLISSNTNAAAIMIGEKASDLIRSGEV